MLGCFPPLLLCIIIWAAVLAGWLSSAQPLSYSPSLWEVIEPLIEVGILWRVQAVVCLGGFGNLEAYGLQSLLLLIGGNPLGSQKASMSVKSDLP